MLYKFEKPILIYFINLTPKLDMVQCMVSFIRKQKSH